MQAKIVEGIHRLRGVRQNTDHVGGGKILDFKFDCLIR
jgi:hypothetical protein